jgi:hypothetical protein
MIPTANLELHDAQGNVCLVKVEGQNVTTYVDRLIAENQNGSGQAHLAANAEEPLTMPVMNFNQSKAAPAAPAAPAALAAPAANDGDEEPLVMPVMNFNKSKAAPAALAAPAADDEEEALAILQCVDSRAGWI